MATGGGGTVLVTGVSTGIGVPARSISTPLGSRSSPGSGVKRTSIGYERRAAAAAAGDPGHNRTANRSPMRRAGAAGSPDGLAGLVNNAGIAVAGPLEAIPIDEFRRQIEVNLTGQVAVTQAGAPTASSEARKPDLHQSDNGALAAPCPLRRTAPPSRGRSDRRCASDRAAAVWRPGGADRSRERYARQSGRSPLLARPRCASAIHATSSPSTAAMSDSVEASAASSPPQGAPPERVAPRRRPRPHEAAPSGRAIRSGRTRSWRRSSRALSPPTWRRLVARASRSPLRLGARP